VDEEEFLAWLFRRFGLTTSGPGDDCAVLSGGLCVTVDSVVEGKEFTKETEAFLVGYKAGAVSLSDLAAMGARAESLLCAAVVPHHRRNEVRELVDGLVAACRRVGAKLVGGDYATGTQRLVLTTVALGHSARPIPRSGAEPGMVVCVTGALGGSILGKHLSFRPKVKEGLELSRLGVAAMIDISDGLLLDAWRICRASRVGMVLKEGSIPVSAAAKQLSNRSGKPPLQHALSDGEDFELLFCCRRGVFEKARSIVVPLFLIGEVVEEPGLWIEDEGRKRRVEPEGYVHGGG